MAMSLSLSPASDAPAQQATVDSSNLSVSNSSSTTTLSNDHQSHIAPSKRKPSRRANTAERRATHNAVERQRRETLNGRFLDLATLLPNLSQIRRPSKSSIVNSSIAHIQASRRHRQVASRELKMLKFEADALRREVNEWRDRNGLPRVDEPIRGDGFGIVLAGELEVIQGIAIEEEDEDAEDGFGIGQHMDPIHHPEQQVQAYNSAYLDDAEDEAAILAMYAQQQQQQQQTAYLASQHQLQLQHPILTSQPHELEDPRMAAMLLKNSFSQPIVPSAGYPTVNTRTYANGATNWVPSQVSGFATSHLLTPPPTSHGFSGNTSLSGSPVGGVSANGTNMNSPASTTSSLSSFSSGSPLSMVPSHHSMGFRRERSGSLTGSSPGSQSPPYELHTTYAMQDFSGVPRMGGASFVPSQQHMLGQGLGMQVQPQAIGVGGGANAVMMMMM